MAIATFEGNMTLHDVYDVAEWDDVVEIVRHGQKMVSEREQRNADLMMSGFNGVIKAQSVVVKAIGNLGNLIAKVMG